MKNKNKNREGLTFFYFLFRILPQTSNALWAYMWMQQTPRMRRYICMYRYKYRYIHRSIHPLSYLQLYYCVFYNCFTCLLEPQPLQCLRDAICIGIYVGVHTSLRPSPCSACGMLSQESTIGICILNSLST